jgi:hypothetical protein
MRRFGDECLHHLVAILNRERAAGTEVALDVDAEQRGRHRGSSDLGKVGPGDRPSG